VRSYYGEAERFWRALLDDPARAERKKTVVDVGANVGFYSLWPAADGHRREAVAISCAIMETNFDIDAILLSSI
jgi:tRNA1(Val) A37 N6-methylase TrmN6